MSNKRESDVKMIADFMGMRYGEKRAWSKGLGWTHTIRSLSAFRTSWDWLMPVIRKIDNLNLDINEDLNLIGDITCGLLNVDLDETYNSVVGFIKWYNKENK